MVATMPEVSLGSTLTEKQARGSYAQGEEAVVFALLQFAQQLAIQSASAASTSHDTPATPSGMKPPYAKPTASSRGKKKPGRKKGHLGSRRAKPARIDVYETHRADVCPECGGKLRRDARPLHGRHSRNATGSHRAHDPSRLVPALPKESRADGAHGVAGIDVRQPDAGAHSLTALRLGQHAFANRRGFNFHLQMKVTPGGLVQMWYRLAEILSPWYEQIHQEALNSAVLHGDESGWRVNGKTHWLWCFANSVLSYFMIDRSRGRPALLKFFTQEFGGTLVSDFWGAYNAVACALLQPQRPRCRGPSHADDHLLHVEKTRP